jgi:dinuclear metal center YbgI/SA1388 family protein
VAHRDELIAFCDELLDAQSWDDYGPNGLQVIGSDEVELVVTGVSAHRELFDRATRLGAELVLCHHGLFWGSGPLTVGAQLKSRLKLLFDADASLAAYHLPLDAHPEIGNNALICAALELQRDAPFGDVRGRPIGFVGRAAEPIGLAELTERCARAFARGPLVLEGDGRPIQAVGVVSGGGGSSFAEAVRLGLDAFITGEPEEPLMADARETGVAVVAGGHYATETFGVKALAARLADEFALDWEFLDLPNPV